MVLGAEYPVIRIVEQPGGVAGQVLFFRAVVSTTDSMPRVSQWSARVAKPARPVDWHAILRALDALGIDDYEPPTYRSAIFDAGDLVVEVRRGAEYRAYEVNAPHLRSDTVSLRAARMMRVLDSLARLAPGSD
jgi:hypothetical protein